jgi:chaperonin GroEL
MSKLITKNEEVRTKLVSGIEQLGELVGMTMGSRGRNVIISSGRPPYITKDGVTVAKEVVLKDEVENAGAQLAKQAAIKTNDVAGDGTTTSTVLASKLVVNGEKLINEGKSPISVKRGMDAACAEIVESIRKMAKPISSDDEIVSIATISANNDVETGSIIAEAVNKVGRDGVITTAESQTGETKVEVVDGYQFDHGFVSPYLAQDPDKMVTEFKDPYILLANMDISGLRPIAPVLELVSKQAKPIVIIANDISGDTIPLLVMNKMQGFMACAVKSPEFGDNRTNALQDIAALTGAKVFDSATGLTFDRLQSMSQTEILNVLGSCGSIKITSDKTTIVNGKSNKEELEARIAQVKNLLNETDSDYKKDELNTRLGKLTGGVAVINIGAKTEVELTEKKHRVEDALAATKAALEEGIVPGGGSALAYIKATKVPSESYTDEAMEAGYKLVYETLTAPMSQILKNAGLNYDEFVKEYESKVSNGDKNLGYDVYAYEWKDMLKAGIIDPAKVTRCALENAVSVAGMILTTGAAIVTVVDPVPPASANLKL